MEVASRTAIIVLAAVCVGVSAFAQEDVQGAKDHPMVTRMPGFYIADYTEKEFDSVAFRDEKGQELTIEGRHFDLDYQIKQETRSPSEVQIIRNYINALQRIGGKVMHQTADELYMKVERSGMVTWVHLNPYNGGDNYRLEIVEQKAMTQDVTADAAAMSEDIRTTGHVAVYGITFDADRAEIRPEAEAAIAEIAKLLKRDPSLRLFVVGHTANPGEVEAGLKLSQERAAAVVKKLVEAHGIQADRLSPFGVGPYCPVATNLTEEGRARNRRVELVQR